MGKQVKTPDFTQVASISADDNYYTTVGTSRKGYFAQASQLKDFSVGSISITYAALLALRAGSTLGSGYRYFISLPTVTYNVGSTYANLDEVNDGALNYYKSIQAGNLGNALTDTTWWKQVYRGITLTANAVDVLDMHAEINISSVTNFILFDFTADEILGYSADVINNYYLLDSNTTQVGTDADLLEKTLATYTLPANTLDVDGDIIEIRASGSFAANNNGKTIRVYFGSSILDIGAAANVNDKRWSIYAQVLRDGAATQTTEAIAKNNSYSTIVWGTPFINQQANSLTETLSSAVIIKLTGQNGTAAANDIVLDVFTVEHKKN